MPVPAEPRSPGWSHILNFFFGRLELGRSSCKTGLGGLGGGLPGGLSGLGKKKR